MRRVWMESLIRNWFPDIDWQVSDLTKIADGFKQISELNLGDIFKDVDIEDELVEEFAKRRAEEGIIHRLNGIAQRLGAMIFETPYRNVPLADDSQDFDVEPFELMQRVPKVDFNRANWQELEALPVLGEVRSRRIVEYREKNGPYADFDHLRDVANISRTELETLQAHIFIGKDDLSLQHSSPASRIFTERPSFSNYVTLRLTSPERSIEDVPYTEWITMIDQEVKECFNYLQCLRLSSGRKSVAKKTLASVVLEEMARKKRIEEECPMIPVDAGSLIFDYMYLPVVKTLLSNASRSIDIKMFFLRFDDPGAYPTDELVAELIAAKDRGTSIRVILDLDEESDPYDSASINEPIYTFLKSKDIPVKYDQLDSVMHSKLITIDNLHTVVGSHNWTAGSIYQYDDVSLYLKGDTLCEFFTKRFDDLWVSLPG